MAKDVTQGAIDDFNTRLKKGFDKYQSHIQTSDGNIHRVKSKRNRQFAPRKIQRSQKKKKKSPKY
jgi:hypothetical protein